MREILQEAKKRHAEGSTKATGKKGKSSGQQCGEDELKQVMVRDYLMFKQETRKFIEAKSMVALFKTKEIQQLMLAMMQNWEEEKPEATAEQKKQKQWPAHPYGFNKKSWMFKGVLQMIQDDGLWDEDLDAKQHVDTILAIDNEKIERSIGVSSPKVNTPWQQGSWKFDLVLTEFPVPEMVKAILAFLDCKCNSDKLSVEMRRPMPQPETEQKMWTWLKGQSKQ